MTKADLHVHTSNSHDGILDYDEIVSEYYTRGYRLIAITDHDKLTIKSVQKYMDMTVIPGEEITSENGTHIIGLYLKEEIPSGLPEIDIVQRIKAQGGLVVIPHPLRNGSGLLKVVIGKSNLTDIIQKADFIETISYKEYLNDITEQTVVREIANHIPQNRTVKFIASSDAHTKFQLGKCATFFEGQGFETPDELLQKQVVSKNCSVNSVSKVLSKLLKRVYRTLFIDILNLDYEKRKKIKKFFLGGKFNA